jgi:hypothetical protein
LAEGISSKQRPAALTCLWRERAQAIGKARFGGSIPVVEEMSEGSNGGAPSSREGCRAFPLRLERTVEPLGPKPATCRQARSRWRPDDREVVWHRSLAEGGNANVTRRISKPGAGGVTHGERRAVSEEGVLTAGARDANVGCRNGFEAS